jgi:hypothetical protein
MQTAQPSPSSAGVPRADLLGIAALCGAVLAFEIAYHKIINVQHYGSLGYVVIGSALFGFALAGVLLTVSTTLRRIDSRSLIAASAAGTGLTMAVAYFVTSYTPLDFTAVFDRPIATVAALLACYLALTLPFFLAGLCISVLLSRSERGVSTLYAADLIGAGLGAAAVLPLMDLVGAPGAVWSAAALAVLSAALFALPRSRATTAGFVAAALVLGAIGSAVAPVIDVPVHTNKRGYKEHEAADLFITREWSALTRIDAVDFGKHASEPPGTFGTGILWYDGGSMQSHMFKNGGLLQNIPPFVTESSGTLPYRLRPREHALILASAGGREVIWALSQGTKKVTAVELDPAVNDLVSTELDQYLGGLFNRPDVELVTAEGRSFVQRTDRTFDVIQMVSAYSITMVSTGAAAGMDSYLVTRESIGDYLDRLTDDGVLMISREHGPKLIATAAAALRDRGLDPAMHIYMERSVETYNFNSIFVRKTPWPQDELDRIAEWIVSSGAQPLFVPVGLQELLDARDALAASPRAVDPALDSTRALFARIVAADAAQIDAIAHEQPYHAEVPTDDRPFFYRFNRYMRPLGTDASSPAEMIEIETEQRRYGPLPIGDVAPALVLAEAGVLALVIIALPLTRTRKEAIAAHTPRGAALLYFSMLGIGFIALEIVLMQRFILFLGDPMIAMVVVLGGMLVWAGVGSALVSPVLARGGGTVALVFAAIVAAAATLAFTLSPLFESALHLSLPVRCLIGVAALAPLSILLGGPFAAGLRWTHRLAPRLVPWAWALNGYFTVIGTTLCSVLIPFQGYTRMLLIAGSLYAVAGACAVVLSRAAARAPSQGAHTEAVPT